MFRLFKVNPDEKNVASKAQIEDSTSKMIEDDLGKGGPPVVPPQIVGTVRIYDGSEEIKIDEDGEPYIGKSVSELLLNEQKERQEELSDQDVNQDSQEKSENDQNEGKAFILTKSYRPDPNKPYIPTDDEIKRSREHAKHIRTDTENLYFDPNSDMLFFPPLEEVERRKKEQQASSTKWWCNIL